MTGIEDIIFCSAGFVAAWIWSKRRAATCAAAITDTLAVFFVSTRCKGVPDRRCVGGLCASHCRAICKGKCLE